MMDEKMYYIINVEESKSGVAIFWKPESAGYTSDVRQAGQYTEKKCRELGIIPGLQYLPVEIVTPDVCRMTVPDLFWVNTSLKSV